MTSTKKQLAYLARFDARQDRIRNMSPEDHTAHSQRVVKGEERLNRWGVRWICSLAVAFVVGTAATGALMGGAMLVGVWLLVSSPVLLVIGDQVRERHDIDR